MTPEKLHDMKAYIKAELEERYAESKNLEYKAEDWVTEEWAAVKIVDDFEARKVSGVPEDRLRDIGEKISTLPEDANFHRLVRKIFDARLKNVGEGKDIDWGTAEALAFASLIQDGYNVRISGQDVERGTFSHRHAHVFY